MSRFTLLSSLNLVTLVLVFVIVAGVLIYFLRKRSNRQPLEGRRERNIGADLDAGRAAPDHNPPA